MYKSMIGEKVTVVVSSRGENLLEYIGTLSAVSEDTIELTKVDIQYLMLNFQKGFFGNINGYRKNLDTVVLNKRYIISCNKQ
jgi:ribosome maturation factor RimP